LNTIFPLPDGRIVTAGDGGVIAISDSDGRTFTIMQSPHPRGRAMRRGLQYHTGVAVNDGFLVAGTYGRVDHCVVA
ncbi:MAG: hypothetical protein AAF645_04005, partial [Myxococcota bacterium]